MRAPGTDTRHQTAVAVNTSVARRDAVKKSQGCEFDWQHYGIEFSFTHVRDVM
jgi:hypothetical protein